MRIKQLTFTRFLAAVSIVIFHYGGKSSLLYNDYFAFIFRSADVCVSYFFILSGFLMIIAYKDKTIILAKDYYKNRFARIYPMYLFALLWMVILKIRIGNLDTVGVFLNVFMIQSWIPGKILSLNSPGWSLSVEVVFYAIFPIMFNYFYRKMSLKKMSIYIILFWVSSQLIFHILFYIYGNSQLNFMNDILYSNPLFHINEFLIGNIAAIFYIQKLKEKRGQYDVLILVLMILVILILKFPLRLNFHNGLLAFLFIPIIIFISLNNGIITKVLQKKSFVFLGEISYGIYILQYPIYSLFSAYSINKYFHISDPTIVFFLRLVILIATSSITYIYIEKPIQERIKTKKKLILENPI